MASKETDDHFKVFAAALKANNGRKYGDLPRSELLALQQQHVEKLVALEKEFRTTLIEGQYGVEVYQKFVKYICDECKNILDARPYFRERQGMFTAEISGALKRRNEKALFKFHFNWNFIAFVLRARKWSKTSRIMKLAREINEVRMTIVEMNLPLAISRARIFYSRTPKSHLTHMDFVQIAAVGLLSGVDKFCLPFSSRFRSTCIGRMTGNFIENYSETLLHFYPLDRRKLYRANKAASRMSDQWSSLDFDRVAAEVNKKATNVESNEVTQEELTTPSEIAGLMAASSCVSADEVEPASSLANPDRPPRDTGLSRYAAPASWQPDARYEEREVRTSLVSAFSQLPLLEQKVLYLKGVDPASL